MNKKHSLIILSIIMSILMLFTVPAFADELLGAENPTDETQDASETTIEEETIILPPETEVEEPVEDDDDDPFGEIQYNPNQAEDIAGNYLGDIVPNTTTEQIINWLTQKGNEIIYILQVICQPVVLIVFIIAAFMTLVGCIGKSDAISKGIWAMVICCLCYAAVLYAPIIVQAVISWVGA